MAKNASYFGRTVVVVAWILAGAVSQKMESCTPGIWTRQLGATMPIRFVVSMLDHQFEMWVTVRVQSETKLGAMVATATLSVVSQHQMQTHANALIYQL